MRRGQMSRSLPVVAMGSGAEGLPCCVERDAGMLGSHRTFPSETEYENLADQISGLFANSHAHTHKRTPQHASPYTDMYRNVCGATAAEAFRACYACMRLAASRDGAAGAAGAAGALALLQRQRLGQQRRGEERRRDEHCWFR